MFSTTWYHLGRHLISVLARAGLELNVQWKGTIPKGAVILAANHPCTFDPAIVSLLTKERVSTLIRGSLFKIPLLGRSMRYCGHIPVVDGNGAQALEDAHELLKAGKTVAIFPEGELTPQDGRHVKPRTGLARLALRSGAPVVPIGIHLDQKQLHIVKTRAGDEYETGAWYLHGPYAMTVGEPFTLTGNVENRDYVRTLTSQIMDHIMALANDSARRIRSRRKYNWFSQARWYMVSPLRLVRYWSVLDVVSPKFGDVRA